ncbi:hypothetical protein PHYBOEH_004852 [Phytophthora boehmeriae]|uniref:Elicitin n=1 Tax=Phytophthora boehmeriae TaxID=109152 RepID=A0A8T1WQ43_9STRA|nr:hypothetical protein PHYBOEH_004852 [Phytophthora boehmeriae]
MHSFSSLALICLAVAGSVHAEECSTEQLMTLAGNKNLATCTSDTGVSVSNIGVMTADQVKSVCESTACMALLKDVSSLGDCTMPGTNISVKTDVVDKVSTMCDGSGSMAMSSGSTATSSTGSSTGGTTVGDESGVSSSSSDNVSGGSSSSSSSSSNSAAATAVGCVSALAFVLVSALM